MNLKSFVLVLFSTILITYFFSNCARQVAPTGGLKDSLAPEIISFAPQNYSTNFKSDRVVIKFNEYTKFKDLDKNLIISPALATKPQLENKGKKMIIDFSKCELQANTTYTINLNGILLDITEGNILTNFLYVFSTGSIIDSLRIDGYVYNATTLEPEPDVYVLLHSNLHDSAFAKVIPDFVTRTDKLGNFSVQNIKSAEYKIYALKDLDRSLTYNQENEDIGFIDSIFTPRVESITFLDTTYIDTTSISADSLSFFKTDSIGFFNIDTISELVYYPNSVSIALFRNLSNSQFIKYFSRENKEKITVKFNHKLYKDTLSLNFIPRHDYSNYLIEKLSADSINIWLKDKNMIKNDTLKCVFGYYILNNENDTLWENDTIFPRYTLKDDKNKGKIINRLNFSIKENESITRNDSLLITLSNPIIRFDKEKLFLYKTLDTVAIVKSDGSFYEIDTADNEIYDLQVKPKPDIFRKLHSEDKQSVVSYRYGSGKFYVKFSEPINSDDSFIIKSVDFPNISNFVISEKDLESNSLLCWITNEQIQLLKQPQFEILYSDTVFFVPNIIEEHLFNKYRTPNKSIQKLYINEIQEKNLALNEQLEIIAANPIISIDTSKINIIKTTDSLQTKLDYSFEFDTFRRMYFGLDWEINTNYLISFERNAITDIYKQGNREWDVIFTTQRPTTQKILKNIPFEIENISFQNYNIISTFEENNSYRLCIGTGAFVDIYSVLNDTATLNFKIAGNEIFGNLELSFENVKENLIIQLYDDKFKTLHREIFINKNETINVNFLQPKTYKIKVVFDSNNNKKFDNGNLELKQQPEKIGFYDENITIRSNWDTKIAVDIDVLIYYKTTDNKQLKTPMPQ